MRVLKDVEATSAAAETANHRGQKRVAESLPTETNDDDVIRQARVRRLTYELENLKVVPRGEAWDVDVGALLGPDYTLPSNSDSEILVLCVLGQLTVQYQLLSNLLAGFRRTTHSRDGVRAVAVGSTAASGAMRLVSMDIPYVRPANVARAFTRLGLLHPMGGGREPLDAIVVLDRRGTACKRRLVLPFGWGAGRYVMDDGGGGMVKARLATLLGLAIRTIAEEQQGYG